MRLISTTRLPATVARSATPPRGAGFRAALRRVLGTRGAGFGLIIVLLVIFLAVTAPLVSPYDPNEQDLTAILAKPTFAHPLGTDNIGRDVLSRIVHGTRVAVQAGLISVGFAVVVGSAMGLLAGYWRGWVDDLMMRIADALWSFPSLVLALAIAAALGPGLGNAMIAIGIVFTPIFARLVRGSTLSVREREFVTAARVLGASDARIMARHVFPNVVAPIVVQASLMIAGAIITEASLSFLGLGIQPPAPSWGSMLRSAYQFMQVAPWLSFFPGAAIFITVLGINLLGDGLRRALDPRLRGRGEG